MSSQVHLIAVPSNSGVKKKQSNVYSVPPLITSDKAEGRPTCFCPCLSVCLSVCLLARLLKKRLYNYIWIKRCVSTDVGTWTNWLTFEPDYYVHVYSNMKIEGTEALGCPRKIKARSSRPTCKNCLYLYALLYSTQYRSTHTVFLIFPFLGVPPQSRPTSHLR